MKNEKVFNCGGCMFSNVDYNKYNGRLVCRRYPPQIFVIGNPTEYQRAEYPEVNSTDICGEYRSKLDGSLE